MQFSLDYTDGMKTIGRFVLVFIMLSIPAYAADLTLFSGIQHEGKVSLDTPGSSGGAATQILKNPFNSGAFGIRVSSGGFWGHEETLAYTPNFIDSKSRAFILNSDVLITLPLPVVKPYATAGFGTVVVSGSGISDIGTKLAFNYGGGVKVMAAGPVGVRGDVRGYTLVGVQGHKMNAVEVSLGLVFHF
jgi:opacity protein-like surface antigen